MLRFLGALVVILIVVACVGLYLGWFQVGSDSSGSNTNIEITIKKDKIKSDTVDRIRGQSGTTTPAPPNQN
jgi:hypothetical protein